MKNISKKDWKILSYLGLFIVFLIVFCQTQKDKTIEMVYINPEKCEYYVEKMFNCPWDTRKTYQILDTYIHEEDIYLILLDPQTGSHRSIEKKYTLIPLLNEE